MLSPFIHLLGYGSDGARRSGERIMVIAQIIIHYLLTQQSEHCYRCPDCFHAPHHRRVGSVHVQIVNLSHQLLLMYQKSDLVSVSTFITNKSLVTQR